MDYERIQKPQGGGGFSPGKLRNMLLGVDRKRKEEEEVDSTFTSRSQNSDIDESGGSSSDHCKDVDVVSVLPECSTSATARSFGSEIIGEHSLKDNTIISSHSQHRILEDPSLDYDSGFDSMNISSSMFEFQKAERAPQRVPAGPFSKPAPSKWDDAQKWIASPTSNRPKTGQNQVQGGQIGSRKFGNLGYGSRQPSVKVVVEVPDQQMFASEEPDTKQIDTNQTKMGGHKFVNWKADPYPIEDSYVSLSQHNSSLAIQSATTFVPPASTARSVSMRDMGTEMTPIASQEPSRTGTPVRATSPMHSPTTSQPSTPGRANPESTLTCPLSNLLDTNKNELSEKELQMKTRREIMVLGTQLGKMNIAAWASKEEEDKDASTSLKMKTAEKPAKNVIETRAAAWEEAEKAKYMARFKRDEMKIQAWENHQKAKTEAEMKKIEVEVERIRGRSHDKLMNKLAAARHKAEEKRAAAEAKKNRQAAKTEEQAEYIRRTGRVPPSYLSFSCCNWCS
ncbi:hypothetical protein L6164_026344 [Bauhinia variegata]|uniref:Uncharacterized protein n=1 Tax=Bauhinia variegata TaxID=167791 RepID=A0ACB9LQN3_BAUVA|nr:hypothetical protein L6164_026344 [Bauhinia variegata]